VNVGFRHLARVPPADLHVPILSQLSAAEHALGDALEAGFAGGGTLRDTARGSAAPVIGVEDAPRHGLETVQVALSSAGGGFAGFKEPRRGERKTTTVNDARADEVIK
jgi:hypothetical protein